MATTLPLPRDEDLPAAVRDRLSTLPPLNVLRTFALVPAAFESLQAFAGAIAFAIDFDARGREIAVLRVAHVTGAEYIWHHHVRVAKQLGLADADIQAIAAPRVTELDEEGGLLCRVADEISREVALSADALQSIVERYGRDGAAELIFCCSYFNMLARILRSVGVDIEEEVGAGDP